MKRNFVYSTAGLPAADATNSPPLKKYKSFEENNDLIDDEIDDDDLLDAIGTQALEQFESNNQLTFQDKTNDQHPRIPSVTTSISPGIPSASTVPANTHQPRTIPYRQGNNDTAEYLQLESALKQIKLLEQKIKLLQDEKYSQVGEVKILREKLNQAEVNTHTKVALQQINDQSRLKLAEKEMEWAEKEKRFEEHIASLTSRLTFKEQETSAAAYEKCKSSEQQSKIAQTEFPPPTKEMRVQSDIKVTPVSARCRDSKNAHRGFKNFATDFPTSDPLKALSQQDGCCNKGKLKTRVPQQRCNKTVNTTSTPIHSTPVVDQETQTPADVLQHGKIENGVACMELSDPSTSTSSRKLFNHLISIHPWLSQSCKDRVAPTNGGLLTSTHDRDHGMSMEEDNGEEDRVNYFISLELPTSASSTPFLRNPAVQYDLKQSLANLLGSPHFPPHYPEQNLIPDLDTVGIARGDAGITLLLVLEKLVRKYYLERTKGQDSHCRSVESWVSGSLEGLLPPFASLSDEDRVGHTSRDPKRMDNVQAIVCIMEVLLDLVCHSKPVRCHVLDNCLMIPSKPPLSLDSHLADRKWEDVSSNGRITPCVLERADDGQITMECDNGMIDKLETPDISFSCLKHLVVTPLTGKLSASQRTHYMTEVTVAMSRKVLTESNLDASILSSVVGSYDDQNRSGLTSFMQQGSSSSHSDSSPRASNLFNTLLRLMEPTYKFYEEEAAVISSALEILVVLAQDCSEHQLECYLEPTLGTILRSILRRGRPRMCVMVIDLLYHLASSQEVISNICNNNDDCPLLQAYEQLSNPPKPFTDTDTEYGLKILQMVARSVCTGNKEGGKPMFIFDFDCCCSSELISSLLAFTKRMIKNYMIDRGATYNVYEVISQVTLVLLPVIVNQDIGYDITHSDMYKHDYTEVIKGLSTVLLQSASSNGKWEQAVSTLKELLDYDDLQDCLNTTCNSTTTIKNMVTE